MICYYHHSAQAVGVCKNCQKGVCEECAVDVGNGLACKGRCEAKVAAVNQMTERSIVQARRLGLIYGRNAFWLALFGVAFLIIGVAAFFVFRDMWLLNIMLLVLAGWSLASAMINFAESKKHPG